MAKSHPLSNVDAAWLNMGTPANLMVVSGILMFDKPLDFDRLKISVQRRLLKYDRFRQRVVRGQAPLAKPRWEDDPAFDLSAHLRRIALPEPGDRSVLQTTISKLVSSPLDLDKPLWQIHSLENFRRGGVLLLRIHHAIADGVALMQILSSWANGCPDTSLHFPPGNTGRARYKTKYPSEKSGRGKRSIRVFPEHARKLLASGDNIAATAKRLLLAPPDAKTVFKGELGIAKRVAWSDEIYLSDLKIVGGAAGGTVNNVFMTAITGAFRRYLQNHGETTAVLNFRAAVPVNLRPPGRIHQLGNRFGLVFLALPTGIANPQERLTEIKQRMRVLKNGAEAKITFVALGVLGRSPAKVQNIIVNMFSARSTAVISNVSGPRQKLCLGGAPIRDFIFWPPQSGRLGVGVSITSYNGKVGLGVITDAGLVPDPGVIVAFFHRELDEMTAHFKLKR